MFKSHDNKAILKILEEDSSLREEFYTILDPIVKGLANFDYPEASNFRDYFNFKKILEACANLPKIREEEESERPNATHSLSLEDRIIAFLIGLLPLKLSTFEKKIEKEIEHLRNSDANFMLIIFLDHVLYLLKNPEFREIVLTKKTPVVLNPKIKSSS